MSEHEPEWGIDYGFRKLHGKEREMFRHATIDLFEKLRKAAKRGSDRTKTGVKVFDAIPLEIRAYGLLQAVEPLLGDAPTDPDKICAWNEGTVYAVFKKLESEVAREIKHASRLKDPTRFRRLVRDAWIERYDELGNEDDSGKGGNQPEDSTDMDEWSLKIELLTDRILCDRDFEMGDDFGEEPAAASSEVMRETGIASDYFTAKPPALTAAELARLQRFYMQLLAGDSQKTATPG